MRIIGHIAHPAMKITVFKMDNKLSVKFETGLYEQTFKFRESNEMATFQDMEKLVDEAFCQAVLAQFAIMHQLKNDAMGRALAAVQEDVFEEII
jgi:hypothetical protein